MKKLLILLCALLLVSGCSGNGGNGNVIVENFVDHDVRDVYEWCAGLDENSSCEIVYEDKDGYEKDIVFEQSVDAGKKLNGEIIFKVASGNVSDITVPYTPGMTMADVEWWAASVGMTNVTYVFEASDTAEKNRVLRFEPMAGLKKDTPLTVYISSGPNPVVDTDIKVTYGDYLNITVADFEAKAKALGLKPNHQESRDRFDPNVTIGNIVWHGSGVYVKDEVFNYGICINSITVYPGDYVGKTEDEFKKIATDLTLVPTYVDARDRYSTTIAKGNIVTHGYGNYVKGEEFKYGLSKGPAKVEAGYEGAKEDAFINYLTMLQLKGDRRTSSSNTVSAGRIISYNYGKYSSGDAVVYYVSTGPEATTVNVPSYEGKSEQDFLNFLSNNGLYAGNRTEIETSSYSKGSIIRNDTGLVAKGSKINYSVAAERTDTIILESFDYLDSFVSQPNNYEYAAYMMNHYLFGMCFTNYEVVPLTYRDYDPGYLLRVEVNGQEHTYAENVPVDARIVCYISADPSNN